MKQYLRLTLLVALAGFVFASFTSFLAYPTASHRNVSREQSELTDKRAKIENADSKEAKGYDKKIEGLSKSREAKYTEQVNQYVGFWGSLAFSVAVIGIVYNYIRRQKIAPSGKASIATAVINTLGGFIAVIPWLPVDWALRGSPAVNIDPTTMSVIAIIFVFAFPIMLVITVFWTYLIARIFEFVYNKQHISKKKK